MGHRPGLTRRSIYTSEPQRGETVARPFRAWVCDITVNPRALPWAIGWVAPLGLKKGSSVAAVSRRPGLKVCGSFPIDNKKPLNQDNMSALRLLSPAPARFVPN
jgi:hypothetical protein